MKVPIVIISIILTCLHAKAQELPLYSQYTLNPYLINPSIAGIAGCGILQAVNRTQWTGIPHAPRTYAISYHQRFNQVGLGGNVYSDRNGLSQNLGFQLTFAYHLIKENNGKTGKQLSFGISFCGNQHSIDETQFSPIENDPLVSGTMQSAFALNANAGMYYIDHNFFAGLSCSNLFPNKNSHTKSTIEPTNLRNYFLQFGYSFYLNKPFVLEPSMVIKTTETFNKQVDTNIKCYYNTSIGNRYWVALSYRRNIDKAMGTSISLMPIIGLNNQRFSLAYAFDYTLSPIGQYNFGSHEIMIGYRFCTSQKNVNTCPAYRSYKNWENLSR